MQGDPELLELIRQSVRSVWALELLLLLRRERARSWTPEELVSELRASHTLVGDNLPVLQAAGLVLSEEGRYRYAPATPVLEQLCGRLEEEYRLRPVAVINAIASSPNDRLHKLANAFRLKGDT
jgi:predicted transcriptional regulator